VIATVSSVCNHSIYATVWSSTGTHFAGGRSSVQKYFNFCSEESIASPSLVVVLS
jgi:hypothetical protein